ncbi:mechanosensitive ion channel family protein [Natronomonas sp.]|uniref:mechanosensitive ion channel family protein n=1 Tax=Natronomonas sp. TaxID=2184060 RepID=UPI00262F79DC|nr:mechanosensitive ion channel family protein [Natronomonas sp.]
MFALASLTRVRWFVRWAQLTFDSPSVRYVATAGAAVLFAAVVAALYYGGRRMKRQYGADTVELVQSLVITAMTVAITVFLIAVWRVSGDVVDAFGFLSVTPEAGIKALVTLIVIAAGVTLTRLTKRSVKYGSGRIAITPHQREVAHHVIQILVFIPIGAFTVTLWSIPVRNVFLGAGVLGIVFGFAARKTLSGILSGFVILFARPFEVGDWIRVADWEGIVTDITIYNTQVRTFDEEHVLVPNDTVTENEVVNVSKTDRLRLNTDIGVDYREDVATAARVAVRAMEEVEAVAEQPKPDVIRREFADSAVVLRLRYWITTPRVQEKWRAQNAVIESVKSAFESEDIKIPFPQRELSGRDRVETAAFADDLEAAESRRIEESVTDPPADEDAYR